MFGCGYYCNKQQLLQQQKRYFSNHFRKESSPREWAKTRASSLFPAGMKHLISLDRTRLLVTKIGIRATQ